jgi:ferredoxin-NADP reductase
VIRHRFLTPLRQAARHRLRVAAVIPEVSGVMSLVIEGQHLDELRAEAGQFFRWRFLTPDHWLTAHPFSLSSVPTDRQLRLTVKALGDGSANVHDVGIGTWVVAEGPYGAMTASRRTLDHVVLIAGGVGITPMRALFESLPLVPGQTLTLLYRARSHADVIFHEELEHIAAARGARVHYLLGDNRECLSPATLVSLVPHLAACDVYLCGPEGMASATRTSLASAGVPDEHVHEERFAW